MKIAILTQALKNNYGGILQNLALQSVLKNMGHSPVTIDYNQLTKREKIQMIKRHYKNVFSLHYHKGRFPLPRKIEKPDVKTRQFVEKYIDKTPKMFQIDTSKILEDKTYDAYIVGSDQVWRPQYNNQNELEAMYLKGLTRKIPCIAYAASFGVDFWEYPDDYTMMAREEIKKFTAVSVREQSGVALCENYLKKEAIHVLDPTLLLNKDFYRQFINEKFLNKFPKDAIIVYILDDDLEKENFVTFISSKLKKPVVRIDNNPDKKKLSVEEWLTLFLSAGFIITDSFHGVAFSINFNIPFLVLDNFERGSDRINSILNTFDLSSRRNVSNFKDPINWEIVNYKKKQLIENSLQFLSKSLSV